MLKSKTSSYFLIPLLVLALNYFFVQASYSSSPTSQVTRSVNSTIVFLGTTSSINGLENQYFKNRMATVLNLHKHIPEAQILISGYHSRYYSELDSTKDKLIQNNLNSAKIELHFANDTFDTIRYLENLYQSDPTRQILLVSQKFHLQRASFLANILDIPILNIEAPAVAFTRASLLIHIREVFARIKIYFDLAKYFLN